MEEELKKIIEDITSKFNSLFVPSLKDASIKVDKLIDLLINIVEDDDTNGKLSIEESEIVDEVLEEFLASLNKNKQDAIKYKSYIIDLFKKIKNNSNINPLLSDYQVDLIIAANELFFELISVDVTEPEDEEATEPEDEEATEPEDEEATEPEDEEATEPEDEEATEPEEAGVDLWGGDPKQFADIDGVDNTDTEEDTPISLDKDTPKEEELPTGPATSQEKADMIRLHRSYSDDSPVDRQKLQMYRQAKKELGPGAEWPELVKRAYEIQYKGGTGRYMTGTSQQNKSSSTTQPPQVKKSPKELIATDSSGKPLYFVRISWNNYRPAVQADLDAGVQLFARNPNPIARQFYPFIKVQNMPTRRANLP